MNNINNISQYFNLANTQVLIPIVGKTTGRKFNVREYVYGVLVPDHNHPLSCVSVSNSSLSIDLWTGCAWQCRYCHVQGTLSDLIDDGKMARHPQRRSDFTIEEIINELVKHPFFIPNTTVISIGTASTEPFAPGEVTESTFAIMDAFVHRGLKNPLWIITKGGVPQGRKQDFAQITKAISLLVSLCWADNPDSIEPVQNNRFLHAEEAKEAGVMISWYMRPIVPEWNGTRQRIEMMMLWVKNHYGNIIDSIVPGGLRWTEGIENGLVEIYGLQLPDIPRSDNVKSLPTELWDFILQLGGQYFPGTPIYRHSSCAITHMLSTANLTAVQSMARQDCEESFCPPVQRQLCTASGIYQMTLDKAQQVLDCLGVPARVISFDPHIGVITDPHLGQFTYAIQQTIKKHLALGGQSHDTHG